MSVHTVIYYHKLAFFPIMEDVSVTRRLWPLAVTLLLLLIAGLFVARVVLLYGKIRSGAVRPGETSLSGDITLAPRLAAAIRTQDPNTLVDVVTKDDPSLGSADAKLTIVEFADFGCPYSRRASSAIRSLALTYGDRIRFVYRDFPIAELHPDAVLAAEAGECADEQGKFWAYHDILFQNQNDLSRAALRQYADAVGLDRAKFDRCLGSGTQRNEVSEDIQAGIDAGVVGTPTFFFNGRMVAGAIPLETLQLIVETFLK